MVIEEFLDGNEISILAFSDGYTIKPLPAAQDHKRIFDGDKGPNTGGMGCYAPAPVATPQILSDIQATVLQPTIDGMRRDGINRNWLSDFDLRLSICWPPLHWSNADPNWTKGIRI